MHYKNGREAKNGDRVILLPSYGNPAVAGILYNAVAGNDYCNGRIAITSQNDPMPNLKEVLHADDVAAATIADSSVLGPIESAHQAAPIPDPIPHAEQAPVPTQPETNAVPTGTT